MEEKPIHHKSYPFIQSWSAGISSQSIRGGDTTCPVFVLGGGYLDQVHLNLNLFYFKLLSHFNFKVIATIKDAIWFTISK